MRILAVDAGATSGWAYYDKGTLMDHGNIAQEDLERQEFVWGEGDFGLKHLAQSGIVEYIVIEENMWGNNHRVTWTQGLVVGFWRAAFPGAKYIGVSAVTWRKLCFGDGKMVRKEAKLRARKLVEELGCDVSCEDECEAICIGRVGEQLVNKAKKGKL